MRIEITDYPFNDLIDDAVIERFITTTALLSDLITFSFYLSIIYGENMRCPKCQHDNPDGTLFCEECDHRTDQIYKKKTKIPPLYAIVAALALGVSSLIFILSEFAWYVPMSSGAVGMLLGSYSFTVVRLSDRKDKTTLMMFAATALGLSAVGFMIGITGFE